MATSTVGAKVDREAHLLSSSAIAFYRIWTHRHRTRMRPLKAGNGFTMRDVSPALRFAKPFPAVLCVDRGALAAQ